MEIPAKEWQQGLQKKMQGLLSFFLIVFFIITILKINSEFLSLVLLWIFSIFQTFSQHVLKK